MMTNRLFASAATAAVFILALSASSAVPARAADYRADFRAQNDWFLTATIGNLQVDTPTNSFSGQAAVDNTIGKPGVGQSGGSKSSFQVSGTVDAKDGTLRGKATGQASTYADYRDGTDNHSEGAFTATFEAKPTFHGYWKGTLTRTMTSSRKVGASSPFPEAGAVKTMPFSLQISNSPFHYELESLTIKVTGVEGEVQFRRGENGNWQPFDSSIKLNPGDYISTGYASRASFAINGHALDVFQLTQIRFDEFVTGNNLQRTKLYLQAGAVEARIDRAASIRGDFSVATPGANASIRGSAMVVSYDKTRGTEVYVTEDEAFVAAAGQTEETTVPSGQAIHVSDDGTVDAPRAFANDELASLKGSVNKAPSAAGSGGQSSRHIPWAVLAIAAVAAAIIGWIVWRSRTRSSAARK